MVIEIYTDGSCSPNPGVGGWGYLVEYPNGTREESWGHLPKTTNNIAELEAAVQALRSVPEGSEVTLYSDSRYITRAFTEGWVENWKSYGWKKRRGSLSNAEIWERLYHEASLRRVSWCWVPGHSGDFRNERAHHLANEGRLYPTSVPSS